jgi:hypothetical protein
MNIDINDITLAQGALLLCLVTAIDVLGSMAIAAMQGKFSLAYVAIWIQSHTLRRVFPIFGLAVLGHGLSSGETAFLPAIPVFWAMAVAGLAAYLLETVKSLQNSFGPEDTPPPPDVSPIPAP